MLTSHNDASHRQSRDKQASLPQQRARKGSCIRRDQTTAHGSARLGSKSIDQVTKFRYRPCLARPNENAWTRYMGDPSAHCEILGDAASCSAELPSVAAILRRVSLGHARIVRLTAYHSPCIYWVQQKHIWSAQSQRPHENQQYTVVYVRDECLSIAMSARITPFIPIPQPLAANSLSSVRPRSASASGSTCTCAADTVRI
jgi:hypothetical protein